MSQSTGCSRLCFTLAAIGISATTAAGLFTYTILHEPLESVGASVVSHLGSAKCTAISRTLTALSVARSDVLNGEPEGERSAPDPHTIIGVITPGRWTLEDFHSTSLTASQTVSILRRLPLDSPAAGASTSIKPSSGFGIK